MSVDPRGVGGGWRGQVSYLEWMGINIDVPAKCLLVMCICEYDIAM